MRSIQRRLVRVERVLDTSKVDVQAMHDAMSRMQARTRAKLAALLTGEPAPADDDQAKVDRQLLEAWEREHGSGHTFHDAALRVRQKLEAMALRLNQDGDIDDEGPDAADHPA